MNDTKTKQTGEIDTSKIYTLARFSELSGLKKDALRTARREGLRVLRHATRAYVHGGDFLEFLRSRNDAK